MGWNTGAFLSGTAASPRRFRSLWLMLIIALIAGAMGLARYSTATAASISRTVVRSSDDARSPEVGSFFSSGQTLVIGTGNSTTANVVGFRFTSLAIPKGAIIDRVELRLVKATTQWQRMVVDLSFEASNNAATFTSTSPPAKRPRTVNRAHVDDNVRRVAGSRYTLGDPTQLAKSLQEVVNRSGWTSGASVALIAYGAPTPTFARQDFRAYDAGAASAPALVVTYHTATSGSTATPTRTATSTRTATPTSTPTRTPTPTSTSSTTPVAGQPCPAWVHDRYTAVGPDGKSYPTWHPPVDPQYGCTFGHEHGDNPNGSPALRGRKVLFGYASLKAGMNEPHTGFKVFRWDNIQTTYGPSHNGASYLAVLHQGTSGSARFTTVYHDIEVHYYNPADGREVHVHMLAPFGALKAGCGANDPLMEINQQQANAAGARVIPTSRCFTLPSRPYEDWITALYIGSGGQGTYKAYIDPHFAVFNSNTYCAVQNGACTLGYSDVRDNTGADPAGTQSWYKGTKREAYLNQVWIHNSGGTTAVWTDPYGKLVSSTTAGAIQQYISAVKVDPLVNSSAFGANNNHDPDGSVHAPN